MRPAIPPFRAIAADLEGKGHVRHREEGARYVYLPRRSKAAASPFRLETGCLHFFRGSVTQDHALCWKRADTGRIPASAPGLRGRGGFLRVRTSMIWRSRRLRCCSMFMMC